jgi:hypothetical protein
LIVTGSPAVAEVYELYSVVHTSCGIGWFWKVVAPAGLPK